MPNLRIVADMASDRATLVASSNAGARGVANLLTDLKSKVWRATGPSATLTLTWDLLEYISCVAMPYCNWSPLTTWHITGWSDAAGTVKVLDYTGLACPAAAISLRGWTAAQASSAYAFGGGTCARVWSARVGVRKLTIEITDPANLLGYLEAAARLVVGDYFSPTVNAEYGAGVTPIDNSVEYENAAGDSMVDAGTFKRELSLSMGAMPPADRSKFAGIIRSCRKVHPVFISLFPEGLDFEAERDHSILGRFKDFSESSIAYYDRYSMPFGIKEI
jgi:hypothetical protein